MPPAPEFQLQLLDGTTISASELWDERPVVLFFFASWCGSCIQQQEALDDLAEEVGDAVAFIGIAGEDDPESVTSFLEEHDVAHPTGIDGSLEIWRSYAVFEPPLVAVVSKGGQLVRGFPGGASVEQLTAALDKVVSVDAGGS